MTTCCSLTCCIKKVLFRRYCCGHQPQLLPSRPYFPSRWRFIRRSQATMYSTISVVPLNCSRKATQSSTSVKGVAHVPVAYCKRKHAWAMTIQAKQARPELSCHVSTCLHWLRTRDGSEHLRERATRHAQRERERGSYLKRCVSCVTSVKAT